MQRSRVHQIEKEYEHTGEQDEELHRDLQDPVHPKPLPRLLHALPAQIALHLALIGAEVGKLKEETADQTAPKRVAFRRIPGRIHDRHLPQIIRELYAFTETECIAEVMHQQSESGEDAEEHHGHLLLVRNANG